MKLIGTIQSLARYGGSADPRVEVKLSAVSSEYLADREKGNVHSRCTVGLTWVVPGEYAENLHVNQKLVVTIRTHDSDMEKLERGEE